MADTTPQQTSVSQLASIPGVVGGLIFDSAGTVVASAFPQVFSPEVLQDLARQLTADAFFLDWLTRDGATLDLRYGDGHVLVRSTGAAWVLLLSSAETNGQLLGMALTQVARRLKAGPPPPPPVAAAAAPPSPAARPAAQERTAGEKLAALARAELGPHAEKAIDILAKAGAGQAALAAAVADIEKLTRLFINKKKAEEMGRQMRAVLAG